MATQTVVFCTDPSVTPKTSILLWISVFTVIFGALCNVLSVGHYPGFYIDDSFFAYPALKAAQGGSFTYAISSSAPYAQQLWAYHGPLFPHLLKALFELFGFSSTVARLPQFVGGWLAALIATVYLNRRGYAIAALLFAILWCGDRAPQELMYARMDGLALLCLTLAFILTAQALLRRSDPLALLGGIANGLAALLNPFCAMFGLASIFVLLIARRFRSSVAFAIGLALNLPVLLYLLAFHPREALAQFLWHAHHLPKDPHGALHRSIEMLVILRWSRFWFVALVAFACWLIISEARKFIQQRFRRATLNPELLLAAAFSAAALPMLFRAAAEPYYIVYFSLWPMATFAVFLQTRWRQHAVVATVMLTAWLCSAAWNGFRLREAVKFHPQLNDRAVIAIIHSNIPLMAKIVATPELYSIPPEAGYKNFELTTWFAEHQDICHGCYLLMTEDEYRKGNYVTAQNLAQRNIIYEGPSYPGAAVGQFSIVVLSPEHATT